MTIILSLAFSASYWCFIWLFSSCFVSRIELFISPDGSASIIPLICTCRRWMLYSRPWEFAQITTFVPICRLQDSFSQHFKNRAHLANFVSDHYTDCTFYVSSFRVWPTILSRATVRHEAYNRHNVFFYESMHNTKIFDCIKKSKARRSRSCRWKAK